MSEEFCRFSIAATGAFLHPLGDQTPVDCRYGELINTLALPHKELLVVSAETLLSYGAIKHPRAVVVWNMSGANLQTQPTPEEAATLAAKVLCVGLTSDAGETAGGWLELQPCQPGNPQGGSQVLWLAKGTRVVLWPANPGLRVIVRALVIPGPQ